MNKIDTTKYLRQMKYLPDLTPLANILLIIALIIFPGVLMNWSFLPVLEEPPEMKYAHYAPPNYSLPSVVLKKTGKFYLGGDKGLDNFSELRSKLANQIEELQHKGKKIMIYADAEAPWGKIIDVLHAAKETGINVAGFMMNRQYSILGYWDTKNKYREKGLKYPAVDR